MVVWLFSGGGHTELIGFVKFFKKYFPNHTFERQLPVRPRGPLPKRDNNECPPLPKKNGMGHTGKGLEIKIKKRLTEFQTRGLELKPILVIDDLDCRFYDTAYKGLLKAVVDVIGTQDQTIIGFAAPEVESWFIADYDGTFGKHPKFKAIHKDMRYCLSNNKIDFKKPESFSKLNEKTKISCQDKLSEAIADAFKRCHNKEKNLTFSKKDDSPELLNMADPSIIQSKCPYFKRFWHNLEQMINSKSTL
ncbi:MAG: DUF4276 family protein [Magnetococcus sp. DMHC-6]